MMMSSKTLAERNNGKLPANPVLVSLREDSATSADLGHAVKAHAEFWLSTSDDWTGTPAQITHARRVLHLLSVVYL